MRDEKKPTTQYVDKALPARLVDIEVDSLKPFHNVLSYFAVEPSEYESWQIVMDMPPYDKMPEERTVYVPVDIIQQGMLLSSNGGTLRETYAKSFKPIVASVIIQGVVAGVLGPETESWQERAKTRAINIGGAAAGLLLAKYIDIPLVPQFSELASLSIIGYSIASNWQEATSTNRNVELAVRISETFPHLVRDLQDSVWPKYDFGQVATFHK